MNVGYIYAMQHCTLIPTLPIIGEKFYSTKCIVFFKVSCERVWGSWRGGFPCRAIRSHQSIAPLEGFVSRLAAEHSKSNQGVNGWLWRFVDRLGARLSRSSFDVLSYIYTLQFIHRRVVMTFRLHAELTFEQVSRKRPASNSLRMPVSRCQLIEQEDLEVVSRTAATSDLIWKETRCWHLALEGRISWSRDLKCEWIPKTDCISPNESSSSSSRISVGLFAWTQISNNSQKTIEHSYVYTI